MSYLERETSVHAGQPEELFRFALGTRRWCYTSGQEAVTWQSEEYQPAALARSALEQANELNRIGLDVRMPRDLEVAALFVAAPPAGIVSLTLYRRHQADPDNEFITLWKGRVAGARLSGADGVLRCEPVASSLKRLGLRARYQLTCRHVIYAAGCGALKESYRVDGTVAAVSGLEVQVAAAATLPDGTFIAGYLHADAGDAMIIAHTGITLTLMAPLPGLTPGDGVQLYAGCDHSTACCRDRFNNLANFGGFPYIPEKNPFVGDSIA